MKTFVKYKACCTVLTKSNALEHSYCLAPLKYRLIAIKQSGGLLIPSDPVIELIQVRERAFRILVCGINFDRNLKLKLFQLVSAHPKQVTFHELAIHDLETTEPGEILHSEALKRIVMGEYLQMRLLTFGDRFTKEQIQKGKEGKHHQLTKNII